MHWYGCDHDERCVVLDVSVNHLTDWWLEPREVCQDFEGIPVRGTLGQSRLHGHTMHRVPTLTGPLAAAHKPVVLCTHTHIHMNTCT